MATPRKGGILREFAAGVIDRISGRVTVRRSRSLPASNQREAFTPATQFFPSGMPLTPIAPAGSTTGRRFDFPSFINTTYTAARRAGRRRDQLRDAAPHGVAGGWRLDLLAPRDRDAQRSDGRAALVDPRQEEGRRRRRARADLEAWLARPDGVHTFRQWMRMLLEDHFVIDAPTIYFGDDGRPPAPRSHGRRDDQAADHRR
jgi:hypothetical protein